MAHLLALLYRSAFIKLNKGIIEFIYLKIDYIGNKPLINCELINLLFIQFICSYDSCNYHWYNYDYGKYIRRRCYGFFQLFDNLSTLKIVTSVFGFTYSMVCPLSSHNCI